MAALLLGQPADQWDGKRGGCRPSVISLVLDQLEKYTPGMDKMSDSTLGKIVNFGTLLVGLSLDLRAERSLVRTGMYRLKWSFSPRRRLARLALV